MQSLIIRFTILIVCCLVSASPVAALNISVDTVWPAGTYTINDNITILNGATLTIEDGATVSFATDGYLWVQAGALVATGVTFTWNDGINEWRGISISGSDSESRLVNCTIEHSKGYSDTHPAMIYIYGDVIDPGLLIEDCTFGNGTADQGIHVAGGASPQILNNTFTGFSDAAVNLASTRTATVSGNTFNNNAVGVHINYGSSYVAPTVTGNTYFYSTDADVRVAGNIYSDVAWNEDPGTVYLVAPTNNVLGIEGNGYLTITDGIIVKVNPDKIFWIRSGGVLDATGVTFTAADENNEWNAIWFYSGDSRSRLENCVIERAEGRSTEGYAMVYIYGGDPANIIGCTFGNGGAQRGIHVAGGASPQILNNTFTGFSEAAVNLGHTRTAVVTGNTFDSNTVGVHIYYYADTTPTVTDNTYLYNTNADVRVAGNIYSDVAWNEDPGTVYLVAPTNNVLGIEGNGYLTITDGIIVKVNPDKIFWIRSGGVLDATGVTFTAADENNEWNAIWFYSGDSRSRLENCVIERAEGRSTEGYAMVYIYGSGSPNIIGCTFGNGGAQRGIHVASSSPQILGNTISGFSDYGVYVTGSQSAPFIAGNIITGNNRGIGSFMQSKKMVSRVNHIEGNIEYGFFTGESYIYSVADARYNWWGSSTGPTFTENPLGTGDEITAKVDYLPFFGSIADIEPDGIWDEWEIQNFTNTITATEISDFDDDGLLDAGEFLYGTDPKNSDSDEDGVFDGLEIQCFLNPLLASDFGLDSDNDGFSDLRELISGTDQWDSLDIPEIIADREPQPSGDNDVDGKDLTAFIGEMGSFNCSACQFDLDHDGDVDRADLFLFAEDYGRM